jgi:hypothetical protein
MLYRLTKAVPKADTLIAVSSALHLYFIPRLVC